MTLAERDRVILRVNKKLAKQEGIVIMKTIGTDILSFSLRTTKHKIDIPERGNPFQCFLTKAREFWLSGKVLFGFSFSRASLPVIKAEPESYTKCGLSWPRPGFANQRINRVEHTRCRNVVRVSLPFRFFTFWPENKYLIKTSTTRTLWLILLRKVYITTIFLFGSRRQLRLNAYNIWNN